MTPYMLALASAARVAAADRSRAADPPRFMTPEEKRGWHVETYGGGRFTSVAWYSRAAEANLHCTKLRMSGMWSGMPPRVTPG